MADDDFLQMRGELLSLFDPAEEVADTQLFREEPRKFGKPFDRVDDNLIMIIRSCDQVDFHVHKAVLAIGSVAFEDIFTFLPHRNHRPTRMDRGVEYHIVIKCNDAGKLLL